MTYLVCSMCAGFGCGHCIPQHIYPIDDLKKHITDNLNCWCLPNKRDGNLIIHNSMDGRESYENVRKKH